MLSVPCWSRAILRSTAATLCLWVPRVPVDTLVDYLEGGYSLDEFLNHFPSVRREQAIAALEILREVLLSA